MNMKFIALICIAVIGYVEAISDDEVQQKWEIYKEDFGKTYRSPIESRKRLAIFKDNLQKIEEHNALYEQGKSNYTEGINQFTDWTSEEFLQYVNKGLLDKPVVDGEIYNKTGDIELTNVGHIDWRRYGIVTGVKNQGKCGSCWAFSTTGAIEGQLGRRGRLVSLSEQNLMDCSRNYGNNGCNGGSKTKAYRYVEAHGIQSEHSYPYRAVNEGCHANPSKIITRLSAYVNLRNGDEGSLKTALATKGPVAVSIDATANLQRYRGGILWDNSCSSQRLNHGVLAVGYGSHNGQHYYIVKNSWGSGWGEEGYFRLPMNANNKCGIASGASYPIL